MTKTLYSVNNTPYEAKISSSTLRHFHRSFSEYAHNMTVVYIFNHVNHHIHSPLKTFKDGYTKCQSRTRQNGRGGKKV